VAELFVLCPALPGNNPPGRQCFVLAIGDRFPFAGYRRAYFTHSAELTHDNQQLGLLSLLPVQCSVGTRDENEMTAGPSSISAKKRSVPTGFSRFGPEQSTANERP
jgi:hypothetical protein